jgi:pimeloyl-ACP methyl ester carboxylesterase
VSSTAASFRWRNVQGRPAAYLEAGSGRTVVFLHGWGLGHRAYRGSVRRLAATGVRVLAPALPGFGGTARLPAADLTIDGYAKWVVAFLDELGISERVLLVGHSFGGGVAIQIAHDHPKRVGALVLVNAIGGAAWTADGELVRPMAERPLWDWGLHFTRDFESTRSIGRVLPVMLRSAVPNLFSDPRTFLQSARLARTADLTTELAALQRRGLPVVVVWSRRDELLTEASLDALRDALRRAPTITVAGGHNWLIADPARFGEVMTNVVAVAERARWLDSGRARRWWRRVRAKVPLGSRAVRLGDEADAWPDGRAAGAESTRSGDDDADAAAS